MVRADEDAERADKPRSNQVVHRTTGTWYFLWNKLKGCSFAEMQQQQTHRDKQAKRRERKTIFFTLSSSVILDKRFSTLTLEKPCPFGPSLRPKDSAKARHM